MASAAALGLETLPDLPENQRHDIVLIVPGRGVVVLEVKASSIPTADQVRILAERPPGGAIPVLFVDRSPASVRVARSRVAGSWWTGGSSSRASTASSQVYQDAATHRWDRVLRPFL